MFAFFSYSSGSKSIPTHFSKNVSWEILNVNGPPVSVVTITLKGTDISTISNTEKVNINVTNIGISQVKE